VAPERGDLRHAKARIAQATEVARVGPIVKAIIDELIATIGVVAFSAAAGTS